MKRNKASIPSHRQRHGSNKRILSLSSILCAVRWNAVSALAFSAFGRFSRGQRMIGNLGNNLHLRNTQPFRKLLTSSSRRLGIWPTQGRIHLMHNYSRTRLDMSLITSNDGETNLSNAELQKRYEDAMKRREERRARNESLSDVEREKILTDKNPNENDQGSIRPDGRMETEATMEENQLEPSEYRATKVQGQTQFMMDSDDDSYFEEEDGNESSTRLSSSPVGSSRDQRKSYQRRYDDPYPTEGSRYDRDDYRYDKDEMHSQTSSTTRNKPKCQWETYRSTSILFPPSNAANPPKAILHFVGGTFFGSYPRKFYGKLLEGIALKCDAVVVATPIPLVLPGKQLMNRVGNWLFEDSLNDWDGANRGRSSDAERNNPLDHLHLAEVVQKEFNYAYRDIVIDEYCADFASEDEVEDFMKQVPIVGVGHSLGARIQAISCSHPDIYRYLSMGKGRRLIRSGREGMVYLGFANWGASTSIPGIETLERTVRNRDRSLRQEERDRRGVGQREDVYGNRRTQRRVGYDEPRKRYDRNSDRYSRYDADDLDLGDVFSDVISGVSNGAKQIGAALTPDADDLEFKPSPDELWDDLAAAHGGYGRCCRNTLIVQFDEDPIDQGSRLARVLLSVSRNETNGSDQVYKNLQPDHALHDVKFARLRGGHLTPVSFGDGIGKILPRGAMSLITSSSDFLVQQLGDETQKSSRRQQEELNDVIDTIASYIRDAM